MLEKDITFRWLTTETCPNVDIPLEEDINPLKCFLFAQWSKRAQERLMRSPTDSSGSCKFVSLFIKISFGGIITGNSFHQFNLIKGEIIDLCADNQDVLAMKTPYRIEHRFIGNREHLLSMKSCLPRVLQWQEEYYGQQSVKVKP